VIAADGVLHREIKPVGALDLNLALFFETRMIEGE
jgi:hypothetical protein